MGKDNYGLYLSANTVLIVNDEVILDPIAGSNENDCFKRYSY